MTRSRRVAPSGRGARPGAAAGRAERAVEGPARTPGPDNADDSVAPGSSSEQRILLTFMEIASATAGAEDFDVVLDTLARALGRLFPVDSAALGLLEDESVIVREVSAAHPGGRSEPERLPFDRSHLMGWVIANARPLWRNDLRSELRFKERLSVRGMRSDMVIPLRTRGRVAGAFRVACRRHHAFDPEDFQVLQRCADLTAVAVDTQRLLLATRRLAEIDGVTGVYNHRYFLELGAQEADRARRLGRPLSLLMIDIDNFKRFNDAYGHPTGDEVLRQVAQIVARTVRRSDAVARYGGEEFAVILQDAGIDEACAVGEKIRAEVDAALLAPQSGPGPLHVTISLGAAAIPDHARGSLDLVAAADRGLYEAKRTGKNRLCRASPGPLASVPRPAAPGKPAPS